MTIFEPGGALDLEEHQNIIIQRPELDDVLNHIKKKRHYIALRSPRQMGKTTFLYQIQACLHGHDYGVVYVDLSGLGKATFYQTICAKIRDQLGDLIDGLAEDVLHPHDVTDQDAFSGYLTRLSAHAPQAQKLIITLDEIGGVPEALSSTFFLSLRRFFHDGMLQSDDRDSYRKVTFIFAGALDLRLLMRGKTSPLRNICALFSLNDFSREDICKLANNLTDFPPERVKSIADMVH